MESYVRARIDSATKARAEANLHAMGLSVSDAIRLLMVQVAAEPRLPFDVKIPNKATRAAMDELDSGHGQKFASVDDLMAELNADD